MMIKRIDFTKKRVNYITINGIYVKFLKLCDLFFTNSINFQNRDNSFKVTMLLFFKGY